MARIDNFEKRLRIVEERLDKQDIDNLKRLYIKLDKKRDGLIEQLKEYNVDGYEGENDWIYESCLEDDINIIEAEMWGILTKLKKAGERDWAKRWNFFWCKEKRKMDETLEIILDFMESKVRYYEKKIDELVKEPCYGGTERIELLTRKHTIENLIDDIRKIFELEEE